MSQKLNRGEVASKKRKHCNQPESPTKTKGAEFINIKVTHYVQAIRNRNKLQPHRPPKAKRKNLNGFCLLPTTAERFTSENFYETKTATAFIIRTDDVSPLPCLQRSRLGAEREIVAVSAPH